MARIDDELDKQIESKIKDREARGQSGGRGPRSIFFTKNYPFKDVTLTGDYFEIFFKGERTLTGEVVGENDTPSWTRCQVMAVDNVRGGEGVFSVSENDYFHIREVLKAAGVDYKNALKGTRIKMRRDPTDDPMVYKYDIQVVKNEPADKQQETLPRGPKITELHDAEYEEVLDVGRKLKAEHPKWKEAMLSKMLTDHFLKLNKTVDEVALEAAVDEVCA